MVTDRISKEEYLDKNFDYTKLTKQELRQIMSENNIQDIPNLTALKSVILDAYKVNIYDRIDELKGKFSKENIFQKERGINQSFTIEENSRVNSTLKDSFAKDLTSLGEDISFVNNLSSANPINSSFINQSFDAEEANSTQTSKFKTPFIAIPKKASTAKTLSEKRKYFGCKKILNFCFLIFVISCCYLKFVCPYCRPGLKTFICIPIPPHTKLVGDKLVVDEGYQLVKNIIDFCVPDNQTEIQLHKKIKEYIRILESLKGDYKYGFSKTPRISGSLISDPKVLNGLLKSGKVQLINGMLEALKPRVTFKSFVKFYFYFLIKISIGLILLLIFLKFYVKKRRVRKQLKITATTISKEVLETLNRQIMMSIKSSQFKPYVLSIQMRDALEIKPEVWEYVEEIVSRNSNVEKSKDQNGQIVWKWIGPVLYKHSETVEFQ